MPQLLIVRVNQKVLVDVFTQLDAVTAERDALLETLRQLEKECRNLVSQIDGG